jgi:hypothetical protein
VLYKAKLLYILYQTHIKNVVKKMLAEIPDQLAYFGAELFDDKIVKVGGMNFQEVAKDNVSMYDIGTNEFKRVLILPYPYMIWQL